MSDQCESSGGFIHQIGLYASDEDFVSLVRRFLAAGRDRDEPMLIVTNAANLALIGRSLGSSVGNIDYAETDDLGRRPVQRFGALHRYWRRHAEAGQERVRILFESGWTGLAPHQISAIKRLESAYNLAMADLGIDMVCPYNTRALDAAIISDAMRTHPRVLHGDRSEFNAEFDDPHDFIGAYDAKELAPPSDGAATLRTDGNPRTLRHFAATAAAAAGMPEAQIAILVLAVGEASDYLAENGPVPTTIRIWTEFTATVCELRTLAVRTTDALCELQPREALPESEIGIWLAHRLCDRLESRTTAQGTTIRLYLPGVRSEKLNQAEELYTP